MSDEKSETGLIVELPDQWVFPDREQTFGDREGGGYSGNGHPVFDGGTPQIGRGGPGSKHDLALPNIMSDLMDVPNANRAQAEAEFAPRFATLVADTERELEEKKQVAKGAQPLSLGASVIIDQQVTLDFIGTNKSLYVTTKPKAYGLYGQSPYFLMDVTPRRKIRDLLNSGQWPQEALEALWALIEDVHRSALEIKLLSLSNDVLAGKLAALAGQREQALGDGDDPSRLLEIILQEQNIHFQQLPEFLQKEVAGAAGTREGMSISQVLNLHKGELERVAAVKLSEVKPYQAPPPYNHNGLIYTFPAENSRIKSPLSQPELEALNELVYLQNNTKLGVKWVGYHEALLKTESARHLTLVANAFAGLAERASRAEQIAEAKRAADEQGRVAAEAEAQRIAAEQANAAAEAIRAAHSFRAPGNISATNPLFMTPAGTIAVVEATAVTLQATIRTLIETLTRLAAGTASGLLVGVSALVYSPKLGNGELPERYAFSTPLSDLVPEHTHDLPVIAAANGTVDLPVRISSKTAPDGQSEVVIVKTDGMVVPTKVRVVAATFNVEQNVYSFMTGDVPPRTLTWTPSVDPGDSSTTSLAEHPVPPVYVGATVTPVEGRIDTFPAIVEAGFDDFIIVFPSDSSLPPIYLMFRDRREDPGVATGDGQPIIGIWLEAASQGAGAAIPSQIADQLRNKDFRNFNKFREALWKAVANDAELAKQFEPSILATMKKGRAPLAKRSERRGLRIKLELHHKVYIAAGGGVYDIDNIVILTPNRHINTHNGSGE
ncbi:MAG: S-type pyocin domain-containing protein [Janthinobacterium lividum]